MDRTDRQTDRQTDSKVVLFGAGQYGKRILEKLMNNGTAPTYIVDNNYSKINELCCLNAFGKVKTFQIHAPEILLTEQKDNLEIIITPNIPIFKEIESQIVKMGLGSCIIENTYATYLDSNEYSIDPNGFVVLDSVGLEASTLCQLKCKLCYMINRDDLTVGSGYLKFSDFKSFVDGNKFINNIELANNGEIFLNPELLDIVIYAYELGIKLRANFGVNFNTLSDELIEALVKYNFQSMNIAIDGASSDTYSAYRVNGDFNVVIDNIKKLNQQKKRYNSELPRLTWQFTIMESNESEVPIAKQLAKQLNMDIRFRMTWDINFRPKDLEILRSETGGLRDLDRDEFLRQNPSRSHLHVPWMSPCSQLWQIPFINWDGRLLGCCWTVKTDYGINVFESGLIEALNSEKYRYAKLMLLGKLPLPSDSKHIPCASCPFYINMVEDNSFFEKIIVS